MSFNPRLYYTLVLAGVVCLAGTAWAKDTDVYLMAPSNTRDDSPNVLIIFDNSGSMASNSITTRPPFDPNVDYCTAVGNPGIACNRVYWSFDGRPPRSDSNNWFTDSKNRCEDSKSVLINTGFYFGSKVIGFRTDGRTSQNGWRSLNGRVDSGLAYVDCQVDGSNAEGYARGGSTSTSQAYTGNQNQEFDWANFTTNATPTLFSGQYMNYWHNSTLAVTQTRLEIAKNAIKNVIDANRNVRFGLMVFNDNDDGGPHGGRVIMKVDTMDDARRTAMKNTIDSLQGTTWTPLAETMWEAYQYYGARNVDYGNDEPGATPARDTSAESGSNYVSPFRYGCQKSYIVYMTDGDPTKDSDADSKIKGLSGLSSSTCSFTSDSRTSCLKDLAGWMRNNDVLASLPGNQTVNTFTIGFGSGISSDGRALLQQTATNGGGKYYAAEDADQLASAFQNAITEILQTNASFSSPSLSVNAFNRLFNNDDVFFALFKPSSSVAWEGNTKKFRLCNSDDVTAHGCTYGAVIDRNGNSAIDSNSKIKDSAVSYWGTTADGAEVTKGGAGAQIPAPTSRALYTYRGSYSGLSATSPATPSRIQASVGNSLYDAAVADPTILGLPTGSTATDVENLIKWMLGQDTYGTDTTTSRWAFADPLHSRPVAVTFGAESLANGQPDPTKPIIKLFVGTNDGAVRIISSDSGREEWAFVPKEMLARQHDLASDPDGSHIYGLDGTPSFWTKDINNDGVIDPTAGDRVYMYISMRRGGRNIYAFDVTPTTKMTSQTDTLSPKLMWVITGGSGDFARLGQSWSRPVIARVAWKCSGTECDDGNALTDDSESRTVLMFAGGYDENKDNGWSADGVGNAIFIVDPLTGARLWWASSDSNATLVLPGMVHSIPSDLALMDSNADGAIDRVYVGDTGGQLWRLDLGAQLDVNSNGGTNGYIFADIGCTGDTRSNNCAATTAQNRRKFFYPPDVSQVKDSDFSSQAYYDLVSIATGDREDPLDFLTTNLTTGSKEAVHNRIYAFRDYNYKTGAPGTLPSPITDGDLYDATANRLGTLTGAALQTEIDSQVKNSKGWFIDLKESSAVTLFNGLNTVWVGEKSLAKTVIFGGVLYVTTFVPANTVTQEATCAASEGESRAYALNFLTGTPEFDYNNDGTKDRYTAVGGGIPSEVVIVIREGGITGLVGTSGGAGSVTPPDTTGIWRTYWLEK